MKSITTTILLSAFMSLGLANPLAPSSHDASLSIPLNTRQTPTLNAETDRLLFVAPISSFLASRSAHRPQGLDWTSDGCSSSPNNPFGFDFLGACTRHDFGYRNYKLQGRWEPTGKAQIDKNFRADLYDQCARETLDDSCRFTADMYYRAVKWFGDKRTEVLLTEDKSAVVLMVEGTEMERFVVRGLGLTSSPEDGYVDGKL